MRAQSFLSNEAFPDFPQIEPLSGLLEGGTLVTISGSNLGQKAEDILHSVLVAGIPCTVIPSLYEVSSRYRPAQGSCGSLKSLKGVEII